MEDPSSQNSSPLALQPRPWLSESSSATFSVKGFLRLEKYTENRNKFKIKINLSYNVTSESEIMSYIKIDKPQVASWFLGNVMK